MVNNYTIGEPKKIDAEVKLDLCPLRIFGKEYFTLNASYSKKILISSMPNKGIQEIFLNLDINTLRDIDKNEEKLNEYLSKKIFSLDTNRINIFIMRLTLFPNTHLTHQDITYMHDILCHLKNDILIIPIIDFIGEIEKDILILKYKNLVHNFLEIKNATDDIKVGMMIPASYNPKIIKDIFDYYSDENKQPDFFILDFGGQRLENKYTRLPAIKRAINENLDDSEKRFIYGFNVKSWKKSKEASISEEIRAFLSGIHAIGPRRGKQVNIPPSDDPYSNLPKMFKKTDYQYYRLNEKLFNNNLKSYITSTFNKENIDVSKSYNYVNAYNISNINSEGDFFSRCLNEDNPTDLIKRLKSKPNHLYDNLSKFNKKIMVKQNIKNTTISKYL